MGSNSVFWDRDGRRVARILWVLMGLACAFRPPQVNAAAEPPPPLPQVTLIEPANSDDADITAQAMKEVLQADGLASRVVIRQLNEAATQNLATSSEADGPTLVVAGTSLIAQAATSGHDSTLNALAPIAQLTSDADVVVVPASSPYRNMDDLLEAMRREPGEIRWVGQWVGGTDHPTIWQLARAAGVIPELMQYQSFHHSRDVATQLKRGQFTAGIAPYSVFDAAIRSGAARGLAVVSRLPIGGVPLPTFRQLGIVGVSQTEWCGTFALRSASAAERARLTELVQKMAQSPQWAATLNRFHLRNVYLGGTGFPQLIKEEQKRLAQTSKSLSATQYLRFVTLLWQHLLEWALSLFGAIAALAAALYWQRYSARRRESTLRQALQNLSDEFTQRARQADRSRDAAALRRIMNAQVEREFDHWGLTPAERSIAHLMLKGVRLKEIAGARNTSDRTVRQQAQAIYRKAGLDGRTDLAAYFLESMLGTLELEYGNAAAGSGGAPANSGTQHLASPFH